MPVLQNFNDSNSEYFSKFEKGAKVRFSKENFAKLVINDIGNSSRQVIRSYTQSDVRTMVESFKTPANQANLVSISEMLYAKSPHYRRLIQYYAYMALFSYVLVPKKRLTIDNPEQIQDDYFEVAEFLGLMDIKHTFTKVLEEAFKTDVFYGYIHKTKDDFHIQKFDHSMCKISSIEYGVYNFSINMTVFERDETKLVFYPREVQTKYNAWKSQKTNRGSGQKIGDWVELDGKNTICIKINEGFIETFPPFAGSFDSIFDIEAFKDLRKNKEEINNYMLLSQKVPIRENTNNDNDFAIDLDMMTYFHNMVANNVPDNVGVVTSPMDIDPVRFDKDRVDNDGVAKAERDFWSGNGTSQALFSTDSNTSQGIVMSVKNDEQVIFNVLNQIEKWINRYLYYNFKKSNFNINILHVTYFSKKETYDTLLSASTYGMPLKFHVASVMGLEPIQVIGLTQLENDVFKLHEEFIPLASSHTMSSNEVLKGETGRPTAEESGEELSDEGLRDRDKPDSTV